MADFTPKRIDLSKINGGRRYEPYDGVTPAAINAPVEASAYAQALATNQPDNTEVDKVGVAKVEIVNDGENGTPRLKFFNLKGEKGIDGKDHSEEIAQLNEKLETYFISAKEQIDINSEEISKNSAKIHNLTGALLEGGVMDVVKVSQAFTTRQTADGENIIDNQNIFPKKIAGSTQNCYSLVDFSSAKSVGGLTVTANNNTFTIIVTPLYSYATVLILNITDLLEDGKTYTMWQSVKFSYTNAPGVIYMQINRVSVDGVTDTINNATTSGSESFSVDKSAYTYYQLRIQTGVPELVGDVNSTISFMLYEGTDEKPYQPYFKGLKNAYFERLVSTGKNLFDISQYSPANAYHTTHTITDGIITINGTNADDVYIGVCAVPMYKITQSYLSVKGGQSYTLSFESEIPTGASLRILIQQYDRDGNTNGLIDIKNSNVISFTTKENTAYIFIRFGYMLSKAADSTGSFSNIMLNHGTEALPYEPYTESELGFSSSPDLAVVEEVAGVNDYSEIAEEAAQYNDSVIFLSDMSNVYVGMLVDFYIDGTIISGATARKIMFLDTEAKYIVVDGADPMENVPIDTTVRRSAQVKLPEWDYILPQEQKFVRQTGRVEFTGASEVHLTAYDEELNSCYLKYNLYNLSGREHATGTADGTGGWGVATHHVAPPTNLIFSSWRNATEDSFKVQNGGIYLIFVGKTVEEAIAYLAEQYAAGDPVIVEYKLAEATEEDIVIPNNYTAYQGGLEKVVQGNTDNSEYGAMCTLTNYYFVKVGGATNEQTE